MDVHKPPIAKDTRISTVLAMSSQVSSSTGEPDFQSLLLLKDVLDIYLVVLDIFKAAC